MADISKIKVPGESSARDIKDSTARTAASNAQTTANNALPKAGGTMTGQITLDKMVGTSGVTYSTTVPTAAGTVGQIVFVIQ